MLVPAFGALVALGAVPSGSASPPAVAPPVIEAAPTTWVSQPARKRKKRRALRPGRVGMMFDAGLPDGFVAALVVRPGDWLRFHGGGGTNTVSPTLRGGISLLPFGAGPSITAEVGHALRGDTNDVVRRMVGVDGRLEPYFRRVSYTFVNAHAGVDFGKTWGTFYLHGGVSRVWARLHDVQDTLNADLDRATAGTGTTVTVHRDPMLRIWAPSFKLGAIFYLQ